MITPLSRSTGCMVEKYINSDFDHVVTVAENMNNIKEVVDNKANIDTVATNITTVNAVGTNIEHVTNVHNNMDKIISVEANKDIIDAVADNLVNINNVSTNMTAVVDVHTNMDTVKAVQSNKVNIDLLANNIVPVITVAANIDEVKDVNSNIETIKAVHADEEDIGKVATNITDVVKVANGMENYQVVERFTLLQGQLTIVCNDISAQAASVQVMGQMIDGTTLVPSVDYTVANNTITFKRSYPVGTRVTATQVVYKSDDPIIVIDNQSAFDRKIIAMAIGADISPYLQNGRTLYPRLLVNGNNYVNVDDITANTQITSLTVTPANGGDIIVNTNQGNKVFSRKDAEATTKLDVLSDVFGSKPVALVNGLVITPVNNQYPKLSAFNAIYELPNNSDIYVVKSFIQSSEGDCVISLVTGTDIIARKIEAANNKVLATGSIVPRTLAERFAEVINIKDYGAKGDLFLADGSINPNATDDSQAIRRAIEACPPSGFTFVIPAGGYLHGDGTNPHYPYTHLDKCDNRDGLSGSIFIGVDNRYVFENKKNFSITSSGAVIKSHSMNSCIVHNSMFHFINCDNFKVENITLDGSLPTREAFTTLDYNGYNEQGGIHVIGCNYAEFSNVRSDYHPIDGWAIYGLYGNTTPSWDSEKDKYPKYTEPAKSIILTNCTGDWCHRQGLSGVVTNRLIIRGGSYSFTGVIKGTSPTAGIDLEEGYDTKYRGQPLSEISGVKFESTVGAGLALHWGTYLSSVKRCHFINCGIFSPKDSDNLTDNNVIEDNMFINRDDNAEHMNNTYKWYNPRESGAMIILYGQNGVRIQNNHFIYHRDFALPKVGTGMILGGAQFSNNYLKTIFYNAHLATYDEGNVPENNGWVINKSSSFTFNRLHNIFGTDRYAGIINCEGDIIDNEFTADLSTYNFKPEVVMGTLFGHSDRRRGNTRNTFNSTLYTGPNNRKMYKSYSVNKEQQSTYVSDTWYGIALLVSTNAAAIEVETMDSSGYNPHRHDVYKISRAWKSNKKWLNIEYQSNLPQESLQGLSNLVVSDPVEKDGVSTMVIMRHDGIRIPTFTYFCVTASDTLLGAELPLQIEVLRPGDPRLADYTTFTRCLKSSNVISAGDPLAKIVAPQNNNVVPGMSYFDSVDKKTYWRFGTKWVDAMGTNKP